MDEKRHEKSPEATELISKHPCGILTPKNSIPPEP